MKLLAILIILVSSSCTKKIEPKVNECLMIKRSADRLSEYVYSAHERMGNFPSHEDISKELVIADFSWDHFSGASSDWEFAEVSEDQFLIRYTGKGAAECKSVFFFSQDRDK